MVLTLCQVSQHLAQLSTDAAIVVVEEDTTVIGAATPNFCRRCEPVEALQGET